MTWAGIIFLRKLINNNKIKIRLSTVNDYYNGGVKLILDVVTYELINDPAKKFI